MASRREFVRRLLAGTTGLALAPAWALAEVHRLVPTPSPPVEAFLRFTAIVRNRYGVAETISRRYFQDELGIEPRMVIPLPPGTTAIEGLRITAERDIPFPVNVTLPQIDPRNGEITVLAMHPGQSFLQFGTSDGEPAGLVGPTDVEPEDPLYPVYARMRSQSFGHDPNSRPK